MSNAAATRAKGQTNLNTQKRPSSRVIKPNPTIADNKEEFTKQIEGIRNNNGLYLQPIRYLLQPEAADIRNGYKTGDVQAVTPVFRNDGSYAYLEIRTECIGPTVSKQYHIIYRAEVTGSNDPRFDGPLEFCNSQKALYDNELAVPLNAPKLLEAVDLFKNIDNQDKLQPIFLWTEGEKARLGLQQTIDQEIALFYEHGLNPVTTGFLSGYKGATQTCLTIRPREHPQNIFSGKNDKALDLNVAKHFLIRDNDTTGTSERAHLANNLIRNGVDEDNIFLVEPAHKSSSAWDDGDPLPIGVTAYDRVLQILTEAEPYTSRWIMKTINRRGDQIIDPLDRKNREKALRMQLSQYYYDYSEGVNVVIADNPFENKFPHDQEITILIKNSLHVMDQPQSIEYMKLEDWRQALLSLCFETKRDKIEEEMLQRIELGKKALTDENKPEMLLVKSFGLPNNTRHQSIGRLIIRDMLAMALRNSFNRPHIIPQLIFILYGEEGTGKSEFCKVLSGGKPGPVSYTDRFSDQLNIEDIIGNGDFQYLTLFQKLRGKIIAEIADKALGNDVRRKFATAFKQLANLGAVFYRDKNARDPRQYNLRCVKFITTNNPTMLGAEMGERRYPIINLDESEWPINKESRRKLLEEPRKFTEPEVLMTRGFNPGLNWLYDNLNPMLAHMYLSKEWEEDLSIPEKDKEAIFEDIARYKAEAGWQVQLQEYLTSTSGVDTKYGGGYPVETKNIIGVRYFNFQNCVQDINKDVDPSQIKSWLTGRGWKEDIRYIGKTKEKPITERIWVYKSDSKFNRDPLIGMATWHKEQSSKGYWTIDDLKSYLKTKEIISDE